MARSARIKSENNQAWYHLHNRMAGSRMEMPFEERGVREKLIEVIKLYANAYFCKVSAFCIMGNHYHIVANFEKYMKLSKAELKERAALIYPDETTCTKNWMDYEWKRFEKRLFDMSEFMRNIQMHFARWYNAKFQRKGRFWADRFKSVLLASDQAVVDCMMYIELNPVRAGIAERPEEYEYSSFSLRDMGKADWLVELSSLIRNASEEEVLREYRERLYYRGEVPAKEGRCIISKEVIAQEVERGFKFHGAYRKRLRYFTDGLIIGSEEQLREWMDRFKEEGRYLSSYKPAAQTEGRILSMRTQRSNFIDNR